MFNMFKKQSEGSTVNLKIEGMHCTSCGMNIDLTLEDIDGVIKSETSYATATTTVIFDSTKTEAAVIKKAIEELGYKTTD